MIKVKIRRIPGNEQFIGDLVEEHGLAVTEVWVNTTHVRFIEPWTDPGAASCTLVFADGKRLSVDDSWYELVSLIG